MSKSILLIDDQESFKEDFKMMAQAKGYNIAWGRSLSDLVEKLTDLNLKIVAVVLDIKCLIDNEQKIEREDFIGEALTYLNRSYPDLPRAILTGDELALDGLKRFFRSENEDIYKKEPVDIENLFNRLDEHSKDHQNRILSQNEKELKELLSKNEGKHLEFKSSLQYCTKENTVNLDLRFEVIKNISAFANSDGGEILIGVENNKNVIGLESTDYLTLKEDDKEDGFRLLIDRLIEDTFGNAFQKNLPDLKFYKTKDKTVCKIQVNKHYEPVFIYRKNKKGESHKAFFIRRQASTAELRDEEISKYISGHWN
jgi:CheY-like chemotaxis protein